ncbi:MAG: hypothetical protein CO128_08830 [Ignavibacteriales bacterium CG_4_9_14_3_um_filter_30_11]|nr:MAG: hypothetical protein CO128_08830 [Ignavibacteriales bacterium CG_4_9_14_3_um_filter_30_11]
MKKLSTLFFFISILSINISPQDLSNYYKGLDKYNSGEFSEAISQFNKFYLQYSYMDENYSTAKYYEADALWKVGQLESTISNLNYFVNNFSNSNFNVDAVYNLGIINYQLGRYDQSRLYFTQFSEKYKNHSNYGPSLYWIGETYLQENILDNAELILKQAIDINSNQYIDYALFSLAKVYDKKNDYKNAVKYYNNLLTFYKDSPLVPYAQKQIGVSYYYLQDYQSSILELNNPLINESDVTEKIQNLYLLANSNFRAKNFTTSEKIYTQIISDFPTTPLVRDAKLGLAWSYFQQKKYDKAYNAFNSIENKRDNISEEASFWSAEAKRYLGNYRSAIDNYKSFLTNYPNSKSVSNAIYKLGIIYYSDKDYVHTKEYLSNERLKSDNRYLAQSYVVLGQIMLNENNFRDAEKYFRNSKNLNIKDQNINNNADLGLAVSLFQQNRNEESLTNLKNINNSFPEFEKNKVLFYIAENNYSLKKYSEAITNYKRIDLTDNELNNLTLYGLGYSYFNLKDFENSSYYLNEFINKYPNDKNIIEAKLSLADSYYGNKDFISSSNIYNEILKEISNSKKADYILYQYAQALYNSGKSEQAVKEFKNLQSKYPNSKYADKSLYVIGWISFQKNNYKDAIENYNIVLQKYPSTSLAPIVYYSIGDAYFNLAQYDSAIATYQKVMIKYPRSQSVFDAVNGIQYCYVAQNKIDEAANFLEEFVNQNPGLNFSDKISYKIGDLYYGLADYKKAEKGYSSFIEKFPNSQLIPDAHYWIGKSAVQLKNNEQAIENYTIVYNSYPNSESASASVIELANLYNSLKKYEDAVTILRSSIDKLKGSAKLAELAFILGTTFVNANNVSSAYDAFNDVISYYSGTIFSEKAKLELGLIDLAAKRYENAEYYFRALSEKRKDDIGAQAQYYLGEALFEQNNLTDAISALVRVNTVYPNYDEWVTKSFLKLGDTFVKQKNNKKAKQMYRNVLSRHTKGKLANEASKKLRRLK